MTSPRAFTWTAFLLAVSPVTPAAVLITVDVTALPLVTFAATGSPADVEDLTTDTHDGITLLKFYSDGLVADAAANIGGNLMPAGAGVAYNSVGPDDGSGDPGDYVDLLLFKHDATAAQLFTTTSPAFTGSTTVDYSAFENVLDRLPALGTTGELRSGWSRSAGGVIGEWAVVPEVSPAAQAGVMGLTLLGWLAWRRGGAKLSQIKWG